VRHTTSPPNPQCRVRSYPVSWPKARTHPQRQTSNRSSASSGSRSFSSAKKPAKRRRPSAFVAAVFRPPAVRHHRKNRSASSRLSLLHSPAPGRHLRCIGLLSDVLGFGGLVRRRPLQPAPLITPQPVISSLTRDAVALAQLGHGLQIALLLQHKPHSLVHHTARFPGHPAVLHAPAPL
jgi:hypothetical protein